MRNIEELGRKDQLGIEAGPSNRPGGTEWRWCCCVHKIGNKMLPCKPGKETRVPESHHSSAVPGICETYRERALAIISICVFRAC